MPWHRRKPAFEAEADGAVAYFVPGEYFAKPRGLQELRSQISSHSG